MDLESSGVHILMPLLSHTTAGTTVAISFFHPLTDVISTIRISGFWHRYHPSSGQ
jgi:hypothetical protein